MSWRENLLWDTGLIDVEYWLEYADEQGDLITSRWYDINNFMIPVRRAIRVWNDNYKSNEDLDYRVTKGMENKTIDFAKRFTEQYGKVNADILLAYLTQEA